MTRTPADRFHAFGAPAVVAVFQVVVALATVGAVALAPPTFMSAVNYRTGGLDVIFPDSGGPVWMVAADVNGDGELDLLVANWCASSRQCTEGNVGVLLNRGDGTFPPVVTYRSGGLHAFSVSAADMNGDGIPDLVVANGCGGLWSLPLPACPDGSLGMLLGNGDGTFQAVQSFPSGGSLTAMVIADVNNDGRLDVVGSNCAPSGQLCPFGNGTVGVLLGNGDGSVQPVQIYESGGLAATFVAVADVDGDHHLDVLVSNQRICDNCRGNVGVLRGRGNGTFESAQTYATDIFAPAFLVAADLNGDQTPDLVLTENVGGGGQLAVLLNRGDGAFHAAVVYSTGGPYATPLVLSDVNGDGKPDLLVSNAQFCEGHPLSDGCVGILLGTGDGTFQPAVTYSSGAIGAWSLAVADFDGDGALDVAVANQCNTSSCAGVATLGVLAGHGDGTFGQAVIYPTDRNSVLVVAADLNGDGNPDLVVGMRPRLPAALAYS
jgi:FG-GAP-like repeat